MTLEPAAVLENVLVPKIYPYISNTSNGHSDGVSFIVICFILPPFNYIKVLFHEEFSSIEMLKNLIYK